MSEGREIHETTLGEDGESVVIRIPREMADRNGLHDGSVAYALETDGGILLVNAEAPFARILEADLRISQKYENALRELAKGATL